MNSESPPASEPQPGHDPSAPVHPARAFAGGFLMGLANLVPGLSGGTMILVLGLYERFIGAIADVTSPPLRPKPSTLAFLAVFGLGGALSVVTLAKLAVWAVSEHRMASFALFIGLTLGVVPELWKLSKPLGPAVFAAMAGGFGLVAALEVLEVNRLEAGLVTLIAVGAAASASMILPGVSGSYVLLIFGMYEVVIGSIPLLGEAPREALATLVPVGIGVVAGIAVLSNLLKWLLRRVPAPTHGALLGLVFGSVIGLWPFQELVHQELAQRPIRKTVEAVLTEGQEFAAAAKEYELNDEQSQLALSFANENPGLGAGDLKWMSRETRRFSPSGLQIGLCLGLGLLGFFATFGLSKTRR